MRAVAIFGPDVTMEEVRRFAVPGIQLEPVGRENPLAGADAALVFGGDGTVHDHLSALVESQVPLLPVPMGSGNDFHRAVGVESVAAALRTWSDFCAGRTAVRRIDLGMISRAVPGADPNFVSYFCCVAGVGLDSEANRRANAMPRWLRAHGGYIVAVLGAVAAYKAQKITIEASSGPSGSTGLREISDPSVPTSAGPGPSGSTGLRSISASAMFVAFGNAPSYGSGMRITPRAEPMMGSWTSASSVKWESCACCGSSRLYFQASISGYRKWSISRPSGSGWKRNRRSTSTPTANSSAGRLWN